MRTGQAIRLLGAEELITPRSRELRRTMRIRKALVVVKTSTVDQVTRSASDSLGSSRLRQLIEEEDGSVAELRASHMQHNESVHKVNRILRNRGIELTHRTDMPTTPTEGFDIVITIGGDGMVLGASHAIRDKTPILGVNSAPSFSVGYLTGCVAEQLDSTLDAFETGVLMPLEVQRLSLRIAGRCIGVPVLNDVLFCADNPAMTSRYKLRWPDGEELQRSSGIWISTPAGSTSALASAGGPTLPLTAKQFAFLIREPYAPPGSSVRFRSAVLTEKQNFSIENRTREASVFLDGSHRRYSVNFGQRIDIGLHPQPLRMIRGKH